MTRAYSFFITQCLELGTYTSSTTKSPTAAVLNCYQSSRKWIAFHSERESAC
uniref:Uncharacterized protein n=1 Tax=Anguilla anguilla TaxID=7936 RepID=A0A0E9RGQ4_ANGAN